MYLHTKVYGHSSQQEQAHSTSALGKRFLEGYAQFADSVIHTTVPQVLWLTSGCYVPGASVLKKMLEYLFSAAQVFCLLSCFL